MFWILSYFEGLSHVGMIPAFPATSQASGRAQSPTTHIPEQVNAMFQTSGVPTIPAVGVVQPITVFRPEVRPATSVDEHKRIDWLQKLDPPHFDGDLTVDAHDFLDRFHEILCNLGLIESNGVNFTTGSYNLGNCNFLACLYKYFHMN